MGTRKQKNTEGKTERKVKGKGFGLRLSFAIILTFCAAWFFFGVRLLGVAELKIFNLVSFAFLILAVFQYIAAFAGKKKKWADIISIVIGSIFLVYCGLGALALVGGIKGYKQLKATEPKPEPKVKTAKTTQSAQSETSEARMKALMAYPVDYENKPTVSQVLDPDNANNLVLTNENDETVEFRQLYVTVYQSKLYLVAETVGLSEEEGGGVVVFRVDYEHDNFSIETDDSISEALFAEYKADAIRAQQAEAEPVPTEYIKPKLSPKAQKAMMITMIVSYSLLLVVGVLFAAIKGISPMFVSIGICDEISAEAYGVVIGTMFATLTPSIGYYFATIAPVELSKKKKIILAAVTTALSLVFAAVFYIVIYCAKIDGFTINMYFEDDDKWFIPLSMAFAVVGIMICYALTLFHINPDKIKTKKPEKCGDRILDVLKHVFALLIYGILKLVKGILKFKEKQPEIFIMVATILLTWLAFFTAFIFAIICIAVLVGVVILYFTGVMSMAYTPSVGQTDNGPSPTDEYYRKDEYTYTDSYGYTQTVYTDRNGKEARDAGGHYVGEISGDGSEKKFTPAGQSHKSDDDE